MNLEEARGLARRIEDELRSVGSVRLDLQPGHVRVDIVIAAAVYTVWDEEDWPWIREKIAHTLG